MSESLVRTLVRFPKISVSTASLVLLSVAITKTCAFTGLNLSRLASKALCLAGLGEGDEVTHASLEPWSRLIAKVAAPCLLLSTDADLCL